MRVSPVCAIYIKNKPKTAKEMKDERLRRYCATKCWTSDLIHQFKWHWLVGITIVQTLQRNRQPKRVERKRFIASMPVLVAVTIWHNNNLITSSLFSFVSPLARPICYSNCFVWCISVSSTVQVIVNYFIVEIVLFTWMMEDDGRWVSMISNKKKNELWLGCGNNKYRSTRI